MNVHYNSKSNASLVERIAEEVCRKLFDKYIMGDVHDFFQ